VQGGLPRGDEVGVVVPSLGVPSLGAHDAELGRRWIQTS
jgi:hypothetical protein